MQSKITKWFLACLVLLTLQTKGQNNVVLEQIQSYSNILPNATYWRLNAQNSSQIIEALDSGILQAISMHRVKDIDPEFIALNKSNQLGKILVNWSKTNHIPYHAYLEVYEMEPNLAYRNNLLDIPESQKDSIRSIWFITCTILDENKNIFFKRTALMSLLQTPTIGIGYATMFALSTPNNIYSAIAKSIGQLSPLHPDISYMEARAPILFATDNYTMPFVHKTPRIPIDTNKRFLIFNFNQQKQILRVPNASMLKINLKEKFTDLNYSILINQIKAKPNWGRNELYKVTQPLRDVRNNINYSVETYMSFNPNGGYEANPMSLIQFVDDSLNKIYLDGILVGNFKMQENVPLKDKWINPNVLYNGYDSTIQLKLGSNFSMQPITADKKIQGTYKNVPFTILTSNNNQLKTVWIQDQIAIIMQGNELPTQMVIIQNDISEEFLHFILLFSYSEIFQTPSNN